MCEAKCSEDGALVTQFSFLQKLYFQATFYGFVAFGIWGIYQQSPVLGRLYAILCLGGVWALNWSLCSHCPYPSQYRSCVFQPYHFVVKFFPYQGPKMSLVKKIVFPASVAIMMLFPLNWLADDMRAFIPFIICCVALVGGFFGYLCRRCRHSNCPFNRCTSTKSP